MRWLKTVFSANSEKAGREALEGFGEIWNEKYPMIYKSWDRYWDDLCGFFKHPSGIRRAVYTANAVGSMNCQLRQATENRTSFSTDDAVLKILYLAVRSAGKKWTMPIRGWRRALNQASR
jgi:putative transposase